MADLFVRLSVCKIIYLILLVFSVVSARYEYQVKIIGLEDFPKIEKKTKQLSRLLSLDTAEDSIQSLSMFRDQLKEDVLKIKEYLASQGFYDARVFPEFLSDRDIDQVIVHIQLGERYIINKVSLVINDNEQPLPKDLNLKATKGMPSVHENILEDKAALVSFFKSSGHAFVEPKDEIVEINHDTLLVTITYEFKLSPKGKYGTITLKGNKAVNSDYIFRFLGWRRGDSYNVRTIEEAEGKLSETRLFERVSIKPSTINNEGEYPLTVFVEESKTQHLRFGGYINFNLGLNGIEAGVVPKYMHDNLFGNNERFEVNTILATTAQDINISISKPHLWVMDASGNIFLSAERRKYEAYEKSSLTPNLGFDYKLFKNVRLSCGVGAEKYQLNNLVTNGKDDFFFCYFPFGYVYDNRDHQFFSQSGLKVLANWTPYFGEPQGLSHIAIKVSAYFPVIGSNWIIASWASWEAMLGAAFDQVPLDKRVYLGGGNDLRGFPSKRVGDLSKLYDANTMVPDGGLAAAAGGLESRMRIYGPVWLALFIEAGQLSKSTNVFSETSSLNDLYSDWGVSVFYFTQFGPFRVDFAHPLVNPNSQNESGWQVHLSFGQAF